MDALSRSYSFIHPSIPSGVGDINAPKKPKSEASFIFGGSKYFHFSSVFVLQIGRLSFEVGEIQYRHIPLISRPRMIGSQCRYVMCCMTAPMTLRASWYKMSPSQCGLYLRSSSATRLCSRNHKVCITSKPTFTVKIFSSLQIG